MNPFSEVRVSQLSKSVVVNRPPAEVIEYIADVDNHPAFIGPLKSVADLKGDPRKPGSSWTWSFILAGVELSGAAETVQYEPASIFSFRTTSGVRSTFVYRVKPADGGTRLNLDVEYDLPENILGRVERPVLERLNDADGQRAVENLKAILDS